MNDLEYMNEYWKGLYYVDNYRISCGPRDALAAYERVYDDAKMNRCQVWVILSKAKRNPRGYYCTFADD